MYAFFFGHIYTIKRILSELTLLSDITFVNLLIFFLLFKVAINCWWPNKKIQYKFDSGLIIVISIVVSRQKWK